MRIKEEQEGTQVPVVSMDYMYLKDGEEGTEGAEEEDSDGKGTPTLVMKDRKHKYIFAHTLPRKGVEPYAVSRVAQDLKILIKAHLGPARRDFIDVQFGPPG